MRLMLRLLVGAAALGLLIGSAEAAPNPSQASATTGELVLQATILVRSEPGGCPADAPDADECFGRTGSGVIPGLGTTSVTYAFLIDKPARCPGDGDVLLPSKGKLIVAGKGEIDLSLSGLSDCFVPASTVLKAKQPFVVTGGTGKYVGASGTGTIQHDTTQTAGGSVGHDIFVGTIAVPGLDFDVTAPVLKGAVAKSVRVTAGRKTARVRYVVTARDEVDGVVPVTCRPPSGTLFRIGRTLVTCSATDKSGNVASAKFTVLVRR